MPHNHNHPHSKRHASLGDNLINLSRVLLSAAALGADVIGAIESAVGARTRSVNEHLKNIGLSLKNQKTAVQIAHEREKIHVTIDKQVKSSYEIELLALKVKREQWSQKNAGIGVADFKADHYPDPGNIRQGIPPEDF